MIYIKEVYPKEKFELAFQELWIAMWELNLDLSKPEALQATLLKHFQESQVREILEATKTAKYKQALLENTQKAVDRGAFGAPWIWAVNGKGEAEPFFGSDR
jgi:glutathione S-transferase kappa 1